MNPAWRTGFSNWINRRYRDELPPVVLTQRRIYILPTKAGVLFGSTVLVMLLGSINYNLSLGYILVFLLGGMGIAAMLHTYRGLAGLSLRPANSAPVFAGAAPDLNILVSNRSNVARYNIEFRLEKIAAIVADIDAGGDTQVSLAIAPMSRGLHRFRRWRITTTYPLGVFRAWSYAHLGNELLIYPAPESNGPPPPEHAASTHDAARAAAGIEDFSGLRRYQTGESLRAIAWKALARGHPLLSKQFTGGGAPEVILSWQDTGVSAGTESRLSRLCRWVLEAERAGQHFALELPGEHIEHGHGANHVARCLRALALYAQDQTR